MDKKHKRKSKRKLNPALTVVAVVLTSVVFLVVFYNKPAPKTPNLPNPPLKSLAAAHGIEIGNLADPDRLSTKAYAGILASQYAFVTVDNNGNWATDGDLRPSPTTYNYSQINSIMAFAKSHNMPVQYHHLVWGEKKFLPSWLKDGHYSKAQLLDIIHGHISNVVGHYKGQIQAWSVVNEAFTRSNHVYGLHDWWADNIGDTSYIDDAFIWAYQADPGAILILNDFNNETQNSISDAEYNYVKGALARGVPISAIGMQMHLSAKNPPSKQAVIANMQRFAALGLKLYITEFDVNLNGISGNTAYKNKVQAQITSSMVRACIESKSCTSFGELGIVDKRHWYDLLGFSKPHSYLFTTHYQPKPAFYSYRDAWAQP